MTEAELPPDPVARPRELPAYTGPRKRKPVLTVEERRIRRRIWIGAGVILVLVALYAYSKTQPTACERWQREVANGDVISIKVMTDRQRRDLVDCVQDELYSGH